LFKGKGGGGARRSTKMGPGGNITCNGPTYIYNKYKPGGGGVGASSIANRRAKNRLATICGSQNNCFPCFTTLGQYSNYTHNPNGYVVCSSNPPPTAPGAPTLDSVVRGNGLLTLNFTLGSDGGSPITNIEYSTDNGATWNSSGRTSSPIVVTGLTNGVTYPVAVRAKNVYGPKNTIGISPSSNVISGTPATTASAPTLNSLTPGNGQLTLNFTLGSTGGSAITNIEYSINNGVTWIPSGVTSSPIVVTGLTNGNTYQVAVRAINAVGTSPSSNVISGIPVTTPSAPTLVSLTPGSGQLTLIFTLGSNGGSPITDIEYSIKIGAPVSIRLTTIKPSGTLSLLAGVTSGAHPAIYQYFIRRIRISSSNTSLINLARSHNYFIEYQRNFDGTDDKNTMIIEFPCSYPEGTILAKDMNAIQQLETIKELQTNWSDNSVSVTIYYRLEELDEIKEWLNKNYNNNIKSCSFLLHNEHGFKQAPFEEITKEQYEELKKKVIPITSGKINIMKDNELSSDCVGGSCPIR
jgi:hypothetical protein